MATIVNTPATGDSSATGLIIGIILAAVVIGLFFVYGLPALRTMSQPPSGMNINVQIPTPAPTPTPTPASSAPNEPN